jgi:hypothetical protein
LGEIGELLAGWEGKACAEVKATLRPRIAARLTEAERRTSPIRFIARPTDDPAIRCPETSLAAARLGWRATISAREGLWRTIAWFSRQRVSEAKADIA